MMNEMRAAEALRALNVMLDRPIGYGVFWRMIAEGRIPAHRVGREWRVLPADIEALAKRLRDAQT